MGPIKAVISAVKNVHKIHLVHERAPRSEFWWVFAILVILFYGTTVFFIELFSDGMKLGTTKDLITAGGVLFYVGLIGMLISITVRRLQDLNLSGWFALLLLIPGGVGILVIAVMCCFKGTPGQNRFGRSPFERYEFTDTDEAEEFG